MQKNPSHVDLLSNPEANKLDNEAITDGVSMIYKLLLKLFL